MISLHRTACCGVLEVNMLSSERTPKEALKGLWEYPYIPLKANPTPFVIFTGVVKNIDIDHARSTRIDDYAKEFAEFLTFHGLGEAIPSEVRQNCYGHNLIQIWIWQPNYENLRAYMREHYKVNSDAS